MTKRNNKVEEYLDREAKCIDMSESSDESDEDINSNVSIEVKKRKSTKGNKKNKKTKTEDFELELNAPKESDQITHKVKFGYRDAAGVSNDKIAFFKIYKNKDDKYEVTKFKYDFSKELIPNVVEALEFFNEILDKNKKKKKPTKK